MKFLKLLDHTSFSQYAQAFPNELLDLCLQTFPSKFDKCRQQIALKGIYRNRTLYRPPNELLSFLLECNLQTSFVEFVKLLRLAITSTVLVLLLYFSQHRKDFFNNEESKNFFRSRMTEERLTALAYLSIEKEIIVILLQNKDDFLKKC